VRAVGFDLDMTLVDTRRGIRAALTELAAETGRDIDVGPIVASLGPPVQTALAPWFAPHEMAEAVAAFRRHMAVVGVTAVDPLPGAEAAIDAVRSRGAQVVVVTSKITPLAEATLANAGLRADVVAGDLWAAGKAVPLHEHGAGAMVGDHPGDMLAAATASIPGLGVTSGASTADELRAAGAVVVFAGLGEFPDWFAGAAG
jgi:phosphoglycolate phosphatase